MSTNPTGKHKSDGTDFVKPVSDTYAFIDPTKQDLAGKHVLITGASKGIGRGTALSYAKAGATGIAVAARSDLSSLVTELEQAATSAGRTRPKVVSVSMDVSSEQSVRDAAKEVQAGFGHLDIVIINAGVAEQFKPILEQDVDAWWSTWQTNILGPFLTLRSFMPMLIASPNNDRTIIALSSIGAHLTAHGASGYQCGKLALLRLMEFVNAEYGEQGVLAYAVHPGGILTDMGKGLGESYRPILIDTTELAGDSMAWLTSERRGWLAGRYVSCTWDMSEMLKKKQEIIDGDLLKVRMAVDLGT